jgi:hypothetical protein
MLMTRTGRLNDDDEARHLATTARRHVSLNRFKRLNRRHRSVAIVVLVTYPDKRVNIPGSLAQPQYVQLLPIISPHVMLSKGVVERFWKHSDGFSSIVSVMPFPNH